MDWKRVTRLCGRMIFAAAFVTSIASGPLGAVALSRWEESRREKAASAVSNAQQQLRRVETETQEDPRLAPLAGVARDAVRLRERLAILELGETGYHQARDRFVGARRLEAEGRSILDRVRQATGEGAAEAASEDPERRRAW